MLTTEVSHEEIFEAMKQINPLVNFHKYMVQCSKETENRQNRILLIFCIMELHWDLFSMLEN